MRLLPPRRPGVVTVATPVVAGRVGRNVGFDAFQVRLQQTVGAGIPYQVFLMLPYALSIAALVIMSRRAAYPAALMVPYVQGVR